MNPPERGPALAIDIGGTKTAAGLVTPDGHIALQRFQPTRAQAGGEAVMRRTIALAEDVCRQASQEHRDLIPVAVGIGTAGQVSPQTGVISFATSALPGWEGMAVRKRMEDALGRPTFVDNDANVMALGEAVFGAGKGHSQIIGLTVGTGVGGGIIIQDQIYHGAWGYAGAIGHIIIDYEGRRTCPCGRRGCLEAYASGPPIVSDFLDSLEEQEVQGLFGPSTGEIGVEKVAELAGQGHPAAVSAIERGAGFLGVGIATLLNLLNPNIVVIGGGVAQIGERYFASVRRVVKERALPTVADTPIVPAELGPHANLVGAACLAWQGLEQRPEEPGGEQA
jgi:glucokinase